MAKKPSKKEAAQTAAPAAPETEVNVPETDMSAPVPSSPRAEADQEVLGFSPPDQHPLSESGAAVPAADSEPVTQPEHETGLIAPLPESAPAEAANQPTAETTNPPEAETQPPPSPEGAGDGGATAPVAAQNLPSPSLIQRAGAYQTQAGKPSNVIRRFVTPMPPDVLAGKP